MKDRTNDSSERPVDRIAYFIPEWPGQTHIWMWREITALQELGLEVIVYSTRPPSDRDKARHSFANSAREDTRYIWPRSILNIAIVTLLCFAFSPARFIRAMKKMAGFPLDKRKGWLTAFKVACSGATVQHMLKNDDIEHIHVASAANSALIAIFVKELTGVSVSIVINANLEWWGGAMSEKIQSADLVVPIAKWIRKEVFELVPNLPKERVVLAPVGVETQVWSSVNRQWPTLGDTVNVVSVGRLHESKGFETLIKAVDIVLRDGYSVKLSILGDGPDRQRIEDLINERSLSKNVHLTGSVSEDVVKASLESADLFVLASNAEPLGVVYMEAMATAIPTIGTNAGGVTEIINHGTTGFLVPPRDPRALADCMMEVIRNGDFALSVGKAGRIKIEQDFDSHKNALVLANAIRSIC